MSKQRSKRIRTCNHCRKDITPRQKRRERVTLGARQFFHAAGGFASCANQGSPNIHGQHTAYFPNNRTSVRTRNLDAVAFGAA